MAHSYRQDQLGELIAEELSDLIRTRMKDPRVGFASITSVQMTGDLRYAKVYVSVMGSADDQRATLKALDHANGFLRHELAQRLTIRYTPEIIFKLDESIARGARVLELMRQVEQEASTSGQATADDPADPEAASNAKASK